MLKLFLKFGYLSFKLPRNILKKQLLLRQDYQMSEGEKMHESI